MRFLVIGGSKQYGKPFEEFGSIDANEGDIFTVDAVIFTGGHDVTPSLYGQNKHPQTHNYIVRDIDEAAYFAIAKRRGIPMFGICRGSQFLTVMNGGQLHQHVSNHALAGVHDITTKDGETIGVTSTHHQMMDLSELRAERDYTLLAWAEHIAGLEEEPEAVEYHDSKALAVQFHPEYMPEYSKGYQYYQVLIHKHLLRYSDTYKDLYDKNQNSIEELTGLVSANNDVLGLKGE